MAKGNQSSIIVNDGAERYLSVMGISQMFIQLIEVTPSTRFSGWKLHIFSTETDDVVNILNKIYETVVFHGCPLKAGTRDFFASNSSGSLQHGKGISIYLPHEMVAMRKYQGFIHFIKSELSGYGKRGIISGDKSIDGTIHYRYEYRVPPSQLPEGGVSPGQVTTYYSPNEGSYKLPGMEDLRL